MIAALLFLSLVLFLAVPSFSKGERGEQGTHAKASLSLPQNRSWFSYMDQALNCFLELTQYADSPIRSTTAFLFEEQDFFYKTVSTYKGESLEKSSFPVDI